MIIFVYWLARLTIGISNLISSELMHLASFQGDTWGDRRHQGWKLTHPMLPQRKEAVLEIIFGTLLTFENVD